MKKMDTNSGGREKYPTGQKVQILLLNGEVDKKHYLIVPEPIEPVEGEDEEQIPEFVRADRKGHVPIREDGTNRFTKIHFRRILPLSSNTNSDGSVQWNATVIESTDKYRAICPKCGNVFNVTPDDEHITCPTDGEFELHWIGDKPMADATKTKDPTKDPTATKKPKAAKKKTPKEPIRVNFDELEKLQNCEFYTRRNVKFDHPDVDVKAHCLLYIGDSPRKYCFNTYNGALGKKATSLFTDEFIANKAIKGAKKERPWFEVKDLDKERASLSKKGYEKS
jgi:hypothetical protein